MLRDYQQRAITLLYSWLQSHQGNPCIVAPTGSGKSHIIAGFCKDVLNSWPQSKILILSHVKELLEQDAEKIRLALGDFAPLGIYSAGIGRKELGYSITVAGIQSVRNKSKELGFMDVVLVDEAHLISHKAEGGYRFLLSELKAINPNLRVIGLTATPYRMGFGVITGEDALFDDLIEPVKIEELINRGFLAPLRSKMPNNLLNVEGVHKRGGEFVAEELQKAVNRKSDNEFIVDEVISRAEDRKAWLFFCSGIAHSEAIRDELRARGISAETVTGKTSKSERNKIISEFKAGNIKALTNSDVLTTGFDYPNIDLVAMCRPTMSPGLYCQMVGRGMRLKSHTDHCLVLDFAGNVRRHGPIINVEPPKHKGSGGEAPIKVCDVCSEIVRASAKVCPACGYEFPPAPKEAIKLHEDDIMGIEPREMGVSTWVWSVQTSKRAGVEMLRVDYYSDDYLGDKVSEYVTILHDGYARYKAEILMREFIQRSNVNVNEFDVNGNYLESIAEAMNHAEFPQRILYKKEGKYFKVWQREWSNGTVGT
ncbi:MAG: DEAD/DEAH box helicase family protein [Synergistaceae bacterium]